MSALHNLLIVVRTVSVARVAVPGGTDVLCVSRVITVAELSGQ
jgi:hypothetical protein